MININQAKAVIDVAVRQHRIHFTTLRLGMAIMNAIHDKHPLEAIGLLGTCDDCYYDDKNIEATLCSLTGEKEAYEYLKKEMEDNG